MEQKTEKQSGGIAVSAEHIFPIIKKWLYSDREIFLRELLSNASDAVTKHRRLVALGKAEESEEPYRVTVTLSPTSRTVTVSDNGIGMSREEVERYICNMALSGALDFIQQYEGEGEGAGIIGHFGLGFYSAFMVADTVELVTRSYTGTPAVHWTANGEGEYEISEGEREGRGTDVVLHIGDEGSEFLEPRRLREVLLRYCAFLPVEIYLRDESAAEEGEPAPVNDPHPLWQRPAAEVEKEEYTAFYRRVFEDVREPVFSVHLAADYPLNFKGVLFFPRISRELEDPRGEVKLYYNQVFVADNIREVIPEWLLGVRGVIDCPELPLNVSRSYLQDSAYVKRVSAYIGKKVADKLTSMMKSDREGYLVMWDELSLLARYAAISDRKFYDRAKPALLLTMADGTKKTPDEVLALAKEKGHGGVLYYATAPDRQGELINLFGARGRMVVLAPDFLDVRFLEALESYCEGLSCRRIEAAAAELAEGSAEDTLLSAATALFEDVSAEGLRLSVGCEHLGADAAPALLCFSEEEVRMREMMRLYAPDAPAADLGARLALNADSPLVLRLLSGGFGEEAPAVARYLLSLALLSHRPLSGSEMTAFLAESYRLLGLLP